MGGDPEDAPQGYEMVVTVTNLNDSGAGSLRAALALTHPRIIRFAVSGTIELQSIIGPESGRVTVEGQTAPGGGICTKGFGWHINCDDVSIQHIRIRPGANANPSNNDGVFINQAARRVVLDHCSLSWAQDENLSIYGQDITIQWCIISEALANSGHPDGEHSKGAFTAYFADRVSFHHNLFAHNQDRNPYIKLGRSDIINNVLYNGGNPALCEPMDGDIQVNFIKNWQKSGVNTFYGKDDASMRLMHNFWPHTLQVYVEGNIGPLRPNDTLAENLAIYENEWLYLVGTRFPFIGSKPVTETDAVTAKTQVLENAGATLPKRDAVDARIVADVDAGTGTIIDDPAEVGGWPDLTAMTPDFLPSPAPGWNPAD